MTVVGLVCAQSRPSEPEDLAHRIGRMSDPEKVTAARSLLDRGVPDASEVDDLAILARSGGGTLILPILEAKIEEILKAANPKDCFTDKSVDPERVVNQLWFTISWVGTQQSLREAAKLLKIDEKRFDRVVYLTMTSAHSSGRGFTVAYQGFDLGDPAVDKRIWAWAEPLLMEELPRVGSALHEGDRGTRRAWADAIAERYGAAPSAEQWTNDPLVSRLKPEVAGKLYNDVHRFAAEAATKRPRK
jgi:hypothetical protein